MSHLEASTADKDYQETLPLQFSFVSGLGAAAITDNAIEVSVIVGTLPEGATPQDILQGEATHANGIVTQWLTGGVVGCTYHIRCIVATNDARDLVGAKNIEVIKR